MVDLPRVSCRTVVGSYRASCVRHVSAGLPLLFASSLLNTSSKNHTLTDVNLSVLPIAIAYKIFLLEFHNLTIPVLSMWNENC